MNRQLFHIGLLMIGIFSSVVAPVVAEDEGYKELHGSWQVIELVDNGRVIPADGIPGWLPSGGRLEFVDKSIVFTSPKDSQRHSRGYAIDATSYPKSLDLFDGGKLIGHGIYRFDENRLIVCLSSPNEAPRPADFSARQGSHRVMIVMSRLNPSDQAQATPTSVTRSVPTAQLPAPPVSTAPPQPTVTQSVTVSPLPTVPSNPVATLPNTRYLTDAEVGSLLPGTWKCNDLYGAFFVTVDRDGSYNTYREAADTSTFHKVFVKLPVSSGTWTLTNGQVNFHCSSTAHADRLYKNFPVSIRSISSAELVCVDHGGNVVKAVRVP